MSTQDRIEQAEEQIYQQQKIVDFDTREFTIEYVVEKYLSGVDEDKNEIYVPEYQRDFVWDEFRQSRLIESIVLGLPIPLIFLAENKDKDNRLEIVDGSQRIRTLAAFVNSELVLNNLEKLNTLNGLKFTDLSTGRQRKIKNTPLRMIVLSDKATEEVRNEIFERINRGSELLQAMEKRKGIYRGIFSDFIYKICAKNELFNKLTNIDSRQEKRQEKEELILRFFALTDTYHSFPDRIGIAKYLDEFLEKKNKEFIHLEDSDDPLETIVKKDKKLNAYYENFKVMLFDVDKFFSYGFSKGPTPQVSRIFFEAVSVGTFLALKESDINITKEETRIWINSHEFSTILAGKYRTHSRNRVIERIDYVKNKLLNHD